MARTKCFKLILILVGFLLGGICFAVVSNTTTLHPSTVSRIQNIIANYPSIVDQDGTINPSKLIQKLPRPAGKELALATLNLLQNQPASPTKDKPTYITLNIKTGVLTAAKTIPQKNQKQYVSMYIPSAPAENIADCQNAWQNDAVCSNDCIMIHGCP